MIHLDTNFLIGALSPATAEDKALRRWLLAREKVRISSIVWSEFLCGPISSGIVEQTAEIFGEPMPFDGVDATLAAQLFNAAGRRRGSLIDCMIAAVAIRSGATLATRNLADFRRFEGFGLLLA